MKTIIKNITFFILTLFTVQAYSQIYVTSFKVQDAYLQDGNILIKSATPTTEIKIEVQFSTYRDNNGNPNPGSIKTKLGTSTSSGGVNFLTPEQQVSSTEFSNAPVLTKIYTVNIEKSKLSNGKIDLFTQQAGSSWGIFSGKRYNYVLEATTTTYYNVARSASFVKNNCPPGSDAQQYTITTYTVPANKYTSTISQADADAKAIAEINVNGQNKANIEQQCVEFGNVKTPYGSQDINYYDYITDIKWNKLSFSGDNVKIEFYSSDKLSLIREIISIAPNTGLLKSTLVGIKNQVAEGRIKITSIDNGISYFSNVFYLNQD
jgi:hypothetical protein